MGHEDKPGRGFGGHGSLRFLQPGHVARVAGLLAGGLVRRRLLDLGFVPGTLVTALRRSPFGDPTAYSVRGSVIALRREDADRVLIEPGPAPPDGDPAG